MLLLVFATLKTQSLTLQIQKGDYYILVLELKKLSRQTVNKIVSPGSTLHVAPINLWVIKPITLFLCVSDPLIKHNI